MSKPTNKANDSNVVIVDPEVQTISSDDDTTTTSTSSSTSPNGSNNKKRRLLTCGLFILIVIVAVAAIIVTTTCNQKNKKASAAIDGDATPIVVVDEDNEEEPATLAPTKPSKVFSVISTVALHDGNEFIDTESYQSKALSWLENNNKFIDTYSDAKIIQRYALACIYYATYAVPNKHTQGALPDGTELPGWARNDHWLSDTNECNWYGIKCDIEEEEDIISTLAEQQSFKNPQDFNEVIEISLYKNRMTGVLPPEISLLGSSLQLLELGMNEYLMGGIDVYDSKPSPESFNPYPITPNNTWLGKMTSLTRLYYPFCKFYSTSVGIPTEIGLLTNLQEYDCAFNVYRGSLVGSTFSPLTNLSWLDISGGYYQSSIPTQILELPSLQDFFIDDSFITMDVSYLTNLKHLYQHVADQNPGITGSLPEADLLSDDLALLSFSYCNISGSIPSSYGDIDNMEKLYFNNNMLTGTVPTELGQLSILREFEIQGNYMYGVMPDEVCDNVLQSSSALDDGTITSLIADCDTTGDIDCPLDACCTACGTQAF